MTKTKQLQIIDNREVLGMDFKIYGTIDNPLFLTKDVARWIEVQNISQMLVKIDEDEKAIYKIDTLGGVQNTWFLTEDGLYEVLMQSRKPIARAFKKEVKIILKQIRKTGGYIPITQEESDEEFIAKALIVAQRTLAKKDELLKQREQLLQEQQPKVEY